jgi:hypothetical protein
MTALSAQWTLSQTAGVQQAIRMAMIKNSLTIVSESADLVHPIKHLKRHTLAVNVLQDPDYWLMRFVYAIAAKDTLVIGSADALIISEVGTLFDLISGVDAAD